MHLSQPKLCTRTALSHGRGGGPDASGSWRAFDRFGSFFSPHFFPLIFFPVICVAFYLRWRSVWAPGSDDCQKERPAARDGVVGRFLLLTRICKRSDHRPTVGSLSADCRPSVDRLSGISRPTVGRHTSTHQSTFGWEDERGYHRPTVGHLLADCRASLARLPTVSRPRVGPYIDQSVEVRVREAIRVRGLSSADCRPTVGWCVASHRSTLGEEGEEHPWGGGGENTVVGKYWPVFLSGSTINSEIRSNAKTL